MVKFDFQNLPSSVFSRLRNDYGLSNKVIELINRGDIEYREGETRQEVRMWGGRLAFALAPGQLISCYRSDLPEVERATYQRLAELLSLEESPANGRHLNHLGRGFIVEYDDRSRQEIDRIAALPISRSVRIRHAMGKIVDHQTMFESIWKVAVKPLRAIS
jgi:hypothetical protein